MKDEPQYFGVTRGTWLIVAGLLFLSSHQDVTPWHNATDAWAHHFTEQICGVLFLLFAIIARPAK